MPGYASIKIDDSLTVEVSSPCAGQRVALRLNSAQASQLAAALLEYAGARAKSWKRGRVTQLGASDLTEVRSESRTPSTPVVRLGKRRDVVRLK